MVMKPLWVLTGSIPGAGGTVVTMVVSVAIEVTGRVDTTTGSGGAGKTLGGTRTRGAVGHGPFGL